MLDQQSTAEGHRGNKEMECKVRNLRGRRCRTPGPFAFPVLCTLSILFPGIATAGPFVEFLGQTFYIARGEMDGSMGVAFDPLQRKVLSVGLTDPCGGNLESPFADQGAAWDPVDEKFWIINQQREVKVWDAGTQAPLFTIPEVFEVPGVGPDTLESVRGLALDEEFLYVVDAGPDFGEIESNAWFKFTRDGTPVSSSKATDFTANLDAAPDATVDGICWIPPEAPYGAGLFLVALEHSGFQVIDADGFFVDELVWEHEDIPIGAVPFAFSGITMDPLTGDLYLVENSGSKMYVWVRLPEEEVPVVYSIGFPHLRIHTSTGECPRETFFGTGDPGDLFFSLAYRPSDGRFWTSQFNTGEIFLLDPRSGLKTTTGIQGPPNIWGMAYDEANDLMYLHASDNQQIWVHDVQTQMTTQLPSTVGHFTRDIAFRPSDGRLYSVESGSPHNLVWIDPATGAGTVVGPTGAVIGLDYDESTDRLLGIVRSTESLIAIDPNTGAFALLEDLSGQEFSTETLGIIPHGPGSTSSAGEDGSYDSPDPADPTSPSTNAPNAIKQVSTLRSFPNPSAGEMEIVWLPSRNGEMGRPGSQPAGEQPGASNETREGDGTLAGTEIEVLDLMGRSIRRIATGGMRSVQWDGLDALGRPVPNGIYFLRARGGEPATGRVVVRR